MRGTLKHTATWAMLAIILATGTAPVFADASPSDFSLQVTPSPLVTTVKPGTKTQLELKIRNGGSGTEQLKIEPRSFTLSSNSNAVRLLDTTPPDIARWISFSAPSFTIQPGQWENEEITLNIPKDAGFSYAFALVISRQNTPKASEGSRVINGSVAVFTLINIDRPGTTSSLKVNGFSVSKHMYEYLPATFSVRFRNTGNTITQPYGNIFIQRGSHTQAPLASLTVNTTHGYILPGTERTITATWNDGFPAYQTTQNTDGTTQQKLVWNWASLSKLRIGHYTAHLVAVYSSGGHDVPIESSVSFWVIPWKILLGVLTATLLLLFAIFMIARSAARPIWRYVRNKRKAPPQPTAEKS